MKEFILSLLSFFILAGFFFSSYTVLTGSIKTTDANMLLLIGTVLGNISSMAMVVVGYWYGTTKGSGDKDKTISNLSQNTSV